MRRFCTILFILFSQYSHAQKLAGRIRDGILSPLKNVSVVVCRYDKVVTKSVTDNNGNYSCSLPEYGYYEVLFVASSHDTLVKTVVPVFSDSNAMYAGRLSKFTKWTGRLPQTYYIQNTRNNAVPEMVTPDPYSRGSNISYTPCNGHAPDIMDPVVIVAYKMPLMDTTPWIDRFIQNYETYWTFPVNGILDLTSIGTGVYQRRRGDPISICGSRPDGILYIVDGVWIQRW